MTEFRGVAHNAAHFIMNAQMLDAAGVAQNARAEQLSMDDFAAIARQL